MPLQAVFLVEAGRGGIQAAPAVGRLHVLRQRLGQPEVRDLDDAQLAPKAEVSGVVGDAPKH